MMAAAESGAAAAFLAKPLRQQRRILARLNEAAAREAESAAELRALWAALPDGARRALLARPAGCGCGARAGAFGPRLTRACARCGGELHAPCLGVAPPPLHAHRAPEAAVGGKRARTDSAAAGAETHAARGDGRADGLDAAPAAWTAACRCAFAAARAISDADGAPPPAEPPAAREMCARVASLACAFGAAGLPDVRATEWSGGLSPAARARDALAAAPASAPPLVSLLKPAVCELLSAHCRAWLRCLAAAAPPTQGLEGLRRVVGAELIDHYQSALRAAAHARKACQAEDRTREHENRPGGDGDDDDGDDDEGSTDDLERRPAVAELDGPHADDVAEDEEGADGDTGGRNGSTADSLAAQALRARLARRAARLCALTAALSGAHYVEFSRHARASLERSTSLDAGRAQLSAWLAPAHVPHSDARSRVWLGAAAYLARDHIGEVIGAAMDARAGGWPERARLPLGLAEAAQALEAVGIGLRSLAE
ncbi:hypothetical protein KFE25_004716 [Diacronema lutheri]|uniref:Uncharacterized protein n=1 Tax=Diacronema lutheri TaxID=2081491 RepID=A0A8J6CAL6_DIALT|nr:hypothetical protein KFE25_004716 [Diacronema lutheri]